MYDIKWIRENPETFDGGLNRRGLEPCSGKLLALDETRRALITRLEQAQARRNAASKLIGQAKAKKDEATAQKLMVEIAEFKTSIPELEAKEKEASVALEKEMAQIPNMPADDVPRGKDETANVERHKYGTKRDYAFKPRQHFELGEALGMMDFELAAKLSGARFVVLQKGLARMERALGQFFIDVHTSEQHGYTEVSPPLIVLDRTMYGTAQLPKFRSDQFFSSWQIDWSDVDSILSAELSHPKLMEEELHPQKLRRVAEKIIGIPPDGEDGSDGEISGSLVNRVAIDGLKLTSLGQLSWLIPTAEVPLTNFVRESIVDEDQLPLRLTACTPCFRAEAGAAGKDTRGMIRQHQFIKCELVSITIPEKSKDEHERMLSCAEEVLKKLDLHYRVVTLCTGDMGFASQKTYDIEVWLPGQATYREISSVSNCGEFQARRMQARYKGKDGKVKGPVHTLNGSGVAVGRALIAVMENYQQEDGSILVPEVLKPYMGGMTKIERA